MSKDKESLRSDRHGMAVRIQEALTGAQDAIDCDNCNNIIGWCAWIQLVTAELVASTVLDIRNKRE